jgi:hypothetical protein
LPLTPDEYNVLEQAVAHRHRIVVNRRGVELIVIPERLLIRPEGEAIEARHPSTGDVLVVKLDDIFSLDVLRW